ncbi:nucleotidyltransferase domain-containing protein [Candidatus Saganbacteria bacterium]|nr:nucleotidyltransferase domain-containing protein [Candidatus Saganbacteria bacterium]
MAFKRNKNIIKKLKFLIGQLNKNIPIKQAYLFGSYAKGQPTTESDIDLALVSSKFTGIRFYDSKMLIPYLSKTSNLIEIHPFTSGDFTQKNLFVDEIKKTGIKLK